MERFAQIAAQALNQVLASQLPRPVALTDLEIPPDPKLGDFAYPCFRLAKERKAAPPQVAQQIAAEITQARALAEGISVSTAGPYVNFTVDPTRVFSAILKDILDSSAEPGLGRYGSLAANSRGNWVLEFSSPNVAKPLMFHHLRTTSLGAALDRIGRYRGYQVTTINHMGDWGKQYGMYVIAFQKFGKKLEDPVTMDELGDLYVRINKLAEQDPEIEKQAGLAFLKLEQGDPGVTAFWRKCVDLSVSEHERVFRRLGVKFDHVWGESHYKDLLAPLLDDLRKRGLLVESEGAQVVEVTDRDGKPLPPCILLKSDGATIYATRDVAAAIYRQERFRFDRMTYIVGGEQRVHFQQVFGVLRRMGLPWEPRCEHVATGLYRFKDAKMSTRKGNAVTLEEILELAKSRVRELMEQRAQARAAEGGEAVPPSDAITEAVAVGAVVFWDLSSDPSRDVLFDVNAIVDFDGETGPYLQYAHTRCVSILRKAEESSTIGWARKAAAGQFEVPFDPATVSRLGKAEELALVKTLGQLPLHLERSLAFAKASQLTNYLIEVTRAFNTFYRECRVLDDAAPELTRARLMLVDATRRILARGMGLLGMPLPERM
jgi:arginyl-tRNA synthetase